MTFKEAAHKFMEWKSEALNTPELYSDIVKDFLDSRSEEWCRTWLLTTYATCYLRDDHICPFCADAPSCHECEWAATYGHCSYDDSVYQQALERLNTTSFVEILPIPKIKRKLEELMPSQEI